jgi:hypothetical protein
MSVFTHTHTHVSVFTNTDKGEAAKTRVALWEEHEVKEAVLAPRSVVGPIIHEPVRHCA